ncbi:hypothetical protein SAMN05444280_10369 [Tangfeifania diversioriginum]|uniref:Uncharacterized protein n=1 Tax=Tangfeifania diversioriginum TaxID=1168035 RepID=A0A1M6BXR2_9BACT|nr:hypothetical protein SAMN05444280_10369 [Tangfeifania diversioriginum]
MRLNTALNRLNKIQKTLSQLPNLSKTPLPHLPPNLIHLIKSSKMNKVDKVGGQREQSATEDKRRKINDKKLFQMTGDNLNKIQK